MKSPIVFVGCLVAADRALCGGWYTLWSEDPTAEGGSVCGMLHADDYGLVVGFDSHTGCARVFTSRGDYGWISHLNLRIVSRPRREFFTNQDLNYSSNFA